MASAVRKFTKSTLIITNLVIAVLFILASLTPYVNPSGWWLFGLFTLGFPVLLLLLLLFIVLWIIVGKPRRIIFSLMALVAGIKTIKETVGVHFANSRVPVNAIKVMSWNVHMFNYYENKKQPGIREKMFALLRETSPDIACFQEFAYTLPEKDTSFTIDSYARRLQMPYHFIQSHPLDSVHLKQIKLHFGKAIFSKYPILHEKHIFRHEGDYNYSFIYADIALPADTVRVFNIHLQSLYFGNREYELVENLGEKEESFDKIEDGSKSILRKIRNGFSRRMEQADTIRKYLDNSPYPVIVCGDFNDVPGSYAYHTVKGNLQDAFVAKGFGLGRTFNRLSPTLRIDNIFVDDKLEVAGYKKYNQALSDHFPVLSFIRSQKD